MITASLIILVVAILLLQLQIIGLKKSLGITDLLLEDIFESTLFPRKKKRGRPAKTNKK